MGVFAVSADIPVDSGGIGRRKHASALVACAYRGNDGSGRIGSLQLVRIVPKTANVDQDIPGTFLGNDTVQRLWQRGRAQRAAVHCAGHDRVRDV